MERQQIGLIAGLIIGLTFVVTSSIVGVLAISTGQTGGIGWRVPYYILGAAAVFTGLVVYLEFNIDDGSKIILTSGAIGICSLFIISFGVEGIIFGVRNPDQLLSNILPYVIAAGLISTGLIIWGVRHWREFTTAHRVR